MKKDDIREELAALEHDQWAHWTRYMLTVLRPVLGLGFYEARGSGIENKPDIVKARESLERWKRQINTPYADLSEKEKGSDREWADKALEIAGKEHIPKEEQERRIDFLRSLADKDRKAVEDKEKFGHFSDLIRTHLSPGFVPKSLPVRLAHRIVPETKKEGEE
jgi:hypothetical protein